MLPAITEAEGMLGEGSEVRLSPCARLPESEEERVVDILRETERVTDGERVEERIGVPEKFPVLVIKIEGV